MNALSTILSINEENRPYPTVTLSYKPNDNDGNIYDVKRNPRLNRFQKQIMNFKQTNKFKRKAMIQKNVDIRESIQKSRQVLKSKQTTDSSTFSDENMKLTIIKHKSSLNKDLKCEK